MKVKFDISNVLKDTYAVNIYAYGTAEDLMDLADKAVLDRMVYMSLTDNKIPDINQMLNDDKLNNYDG